MAKRKIKIIKQGEAERSEVVPEIVSAEEAASDLEANRRSTVKDWIAEYRENDRIEKEDFESDLQAWRNDDTQRETD
jgi:hypothetical protein